MAGQNKVTLILAGESSSLDKTLRDVNRESAATGAAMTHAAEESGHLRDTLKETAGAARGTKELLRGAGDAASLFGGELGNAALQAGVALGTIKDLSKGARELAGTLTLARVAVGGIYTAIAVATVGLAAHIDHTSMMNEVNRTAADTTYYLADGLHFLGQKIPVVGDALARAKDKADDWSRSAHGMASADAAAEDAAGRLMVQMINTGNAAAYSAAQVQKVLSLQSQYGPYKTGYKFDQNNPGYQDLVYTAAMHPAAKKIRSAGSSAKSAAQKAADELRHAQKTVADAVRGLMQAFVPKLDVTTLDNGYSRVGDTRGGGPAGLIGNLKRQAADTIKLRRDLEKLAKMGLDKGLLAELVAGGLASLPAAEDLLKGGKVEVGQANYYAGQINRNANTIATEQTARALTKPDKQTLHINVAGGDADLVKLIRKWVRNNGGNVQGVLGS